MTDPTPDPVEARLRATLTAEADRQPVTPDFAGLRARADRTVVDLDLSPRRNRSRVVAAAAVLALLAGGVVALAGRDGGDDEAPVTTEPPATGYYLPGPGWEIVDVSGMPLLGIGPALGEAGLARQVSFGADIVSSELPDPDAPEPGDDDEAVLVEGSHVLALVFAVTGPIDLGAIPRTEDLRMVEGAAGTYATGTDSDDSAVLAAQVDGHLLLLSWFGTYTEAEAVAMADRWVASDGRELTTDPASGLDRISDLSSRDAVPTDADTFFDDLDGSYDDETTSAAQAVVTVRSPEGWEGVYTLAGPGRSAPPTGIDDADGGRARGLAEPMVELPEDEGPAGPAWAGELGVWADAPGAEISVTILGYTEERLTTEQARALHAALRPVDHRRWLAAVEGQAQDVGLDVEWPARLADARLDFGAMGDASDFERGLTLDPRDGVNPAAGRSPEEVDQLVADTFADLSDGPGPIDADLFAPETAFGDDDEPGGETTVAIEAVVEDAQAAVTGGADPAALDAWNVLWAIGPPDMVVVATEDACPPLGALAADPAVVVLLQDVSVDVGEEPCTDWSALIVRLDGSQQIASVTARYGP